MSRESFEPAGVAAPSGPYSHAVAARGAVVASSGQVAFDERGEIVAGGIQEQTRQALLNLQRSLEAAGCSLADVFKVTVFLADLSGRSAYNEVYAHFFERPYPARTTVQAGLPDGLLVEIEALASLP